jgi:hypothetical protein
MRLPLYYLIVRAKLYKLIQNLKSRNNSVKLRKFQISASSQRTKIKNNHRVAAVLCDDPAASVDPDSDPSFLLKHLTMQPVNLDKGIPPRHDGTEIPRKSVVLKDFIKLKSKLDFPKINFCKEFTKIGINRMLTS